MPHGKPHKDMPNYKPKKANGKPKAKANGKGSTAMKERMAKLRAMKK